MEDIVDDSSSSSSSSFDASLFQLVSSQALQSLLDRIVGPKTLVLSSSLAGPLGLITEVGLLKVSRQLSFGSSTLLCPETEG